MTPQQLKAMKLALEALKKCHYYMINAGLPNQSLLNEAFTAYKALEGLKEHAMRETQRLGQEIEQEPVIGKWSLREVYFDEDGEPISHRSPPQRKPLTKEEMFEAIRPLYSSDKAARLTVNHSKDEYRAIEAAHDIKENT